MTSRPEGPRVSSAPDTSPAQRPEPVRQWWTARTQERTARTQEPTAHHGRMMTPAAVGTAPRTGRL
nr:hypothetical protein [Streptomyces sp. 2224.1]